MTATSSRCTTTFAHHRSRTPAVANGPAEILNNVSYNCRQGFVHNNDAKGHISIVGNTYRRGPSDELFPFYFDFDIPGHNLRYYLRDNAIDDPGLFTGGVDNPWQKPLSHPAFQYLEIAEDGSSSQFRSPTAWEEAHGLSPGDRGDHKKQMPSGYTAIEEYINERAEQLSGITAIEPVPGM